MLYKCLKAERQFFMLVPMIESVLNDYVHIHSKYVSHMYFTVTCR